MAIEREKAASGVESASARQVVRRQNRAGRARNRLPRRRQTGGSNSRNQTRIYNADSVGLVQKCLLVRNSHLHIVNPFHVRHTRPQARIHELPVLPDSLALEVGREIVERVRARIIVVLIAPHKSAERKYCGRTEQARPRRCNVEGLDLRNLVRRSERIPGYRIS